MDKLIDQLERLAQPRVSILGKLGLRSKLVMAISLLISIATYYYIVEFSGSDFSLLTNFRFGGPPHYIFHSGNKPATYYLLGQFLAAQSESSNKINIESKETNGGYANANHVLESPKPSFGIVQSHVLEVDEVLRNNLKLITRLYLERMHVIFNKQKYRQVTGKDPDKLQPTISPTSDPLLLKFLSSAKIGTGLAGGGTKLVSSYIINNLNKQLKDHRIRPLTTNVELALSSLDSGSTDVQFLITGAPNDDIRKLIVAQKDKFGLMNIDASMVEFLNKEYGINLRHTDFKDKYKINDSENVGVYDDTHTLGAYSQLITDKNTPYVDILSFLELLDNADKSTHPVAKVFKNEYKFMENYKKQHYSQRMLQLRSLAVFIVTILTSFFAALISITWLMSNYSQLKYNIRISKVVEDNMPINEEINEELIPNEKESSLLRPHINNNQISIVNKIILGLNSLSHLRKEISSDNGLTGAHATYLFERIDQSTTDLKRNLGRRLNEIIERNENYMISETIRHYFTADYITRDDYQWLKSKLIEEGMNK